jgi:hypothetical protein
VIGPVLGRYARCWAVAHNRAAVQPTRPSRPVCELSRYAVGLSRGGPRLMRGLLGRAAGARASDVFDLFSSGFILEF